MTDENTPAFDQPDPLVDLMVEDVKLAVLGDLTKILESIQTANNLRFDHYDKQSDDLEKRFAMLFQAYGEMAVMVEAILVRLSSNSEEEREALRHDIHEGRKALLDLLKSGSQGGQPDGNPNGAFIPFGSQNPDGGDSQEPS